MPKRTDRSFSPLPETECVLYLAVWERGVTRVAEAKHAKYYRPIHLRFCEKAMAKWLFMYAKDEHIHRYATPQCVVLLYRFNEHYYTCVLTTNYRERIVHNVLFDLANEHKASGGFNMPKEQLVFLTQEKLRWGNDVNNDPYLEGRIKVSKNQEMLNSNLNKAVERGDSLVSLRGKTEMIEQSTYKASEKAKRIHRTVQGNKYKFLLIGCCCVSCIVFVTVSVAFCLFILPLILKFSSGSQSNTPAPIPNDNPKYSPTTDTKQNDNLKQSKQSDNSKSKHSKKSDTSKHSKKGDKSESKHSKSTKKKQSDDDDEYDNEDNENASILSTLELNTNDDPNQLYSKIFREDDDDLRSFLESEAPHQFL